MFSSNVARQWLSQASTQSSQFHMKNIITNTQRIFVVFFHFNLCLCLCFCYYFSGTFMRTVDRSLTKENFFFLLSYPELLYTFTLSVVNIVEYYTERRHTMEKLDISLQIASLIWKIGTFWIVFVCVVCCTRARYRISLFHYIPDTTQRHACLPPKNIYERNEIQCDFHASYSNCAKIFSAFPDTTMKKNKDRREE